MDSEDQHLMSHERDPRMGIDADAVLRVGEILLSAGTDVYRVIRAMKRTARSLGFDRFDASITMSSIRFTGRRGNNFRTEISTLEKYGVDSSLIEAVEDLTHHLPSEITAEWVHEKLDKIENNRRTRWSRVALACAAAVACSAFAILNRFSFDSAVAVAFSALCGQTVRMSFARKRFNQLGTTAVSGIVACLVYFGLSQLFFVTPWGRSEQTLGQGYVAAMLFLIPGFPLFTALVDLARLDIAAGWERFVYAFEIIVSATMAAWIVSACTGLEPSVPAQSGTTEWSWLIVAGIASICGVAGFAMLFNSSRRMIAIAAVVGAIANVVKFICLFIGIPTQVAGLIGGLCVGLIANLIRDRSYIPRITVTIPAVVIMIPGTEMFRGIYYLNDGNINDALTHTVTASLQVFAIAAGLVIARLAADDSWARHRYIDFARRPDHSAD